MPCEHLQTPGDKFLNQRPDGKCRLCRTQIYKKYYLKNRNKVLKKASEWRKNNPEKVKSIKKAYSEKMKNALRLTKKLNKIEMLYVCKLKNIITSISEIKRKYYKHR